MNLWNVKNLEPPPIITATADIKEIDLKLLRNTLKDAIDFFENQPHLFTEAAMLSRVIYRMKMKFRSSKDLKAVEMLNRTLRMYLYLQIPKVLKSFLDSVPQNYKGTRTCLPTKHMIDFVLVRLQSLGKILTKIYGHCQNAAILAQQRLRLGHFWKIAIIFYAMSARIFVITKSLIKYTCELYTNLLPFASKLNNSGKHWLPAGYEFPESLNEWLEIDWVDQETTTIEIPDDEPHPMSYFDLIDDSDDDDIEFSDEYILVRDESIIEIIEPTSSEGSIEERHDEIISLCDTESLPPKENSVTDGLKGFCEDVDVGEIVQVDDDPTILPKKKTHNQKAADEDATNLSTAETPPSIKQKKKKIGSNKNTESTPKNDNIQIKNQKTNSNSDLLSADCSVISLTDSESPRGKKRKRGRSKNKINNQENIKHPSGSSNNEKNEPKENNITDGFKGFCEDIDGAEIVQVDDDQTLLPKKKRHNQKAAGEDAINLSTAKTPPNIKQKSKMKKIECNKNPQPTPKDNNIQIKNQKTNSNSDLLSADCSVIISLTDSEITRGKRRKRGRSKNKINQQENIQHPNTSGYNPNMASASTEDAKKAQVSVPTSPNPNKKRKHRLPKSKIGSVQKNEANVTISETSSSIAKNKRNQKNTKLHNRVRESVRIKQDTYKDQNYKNMNKSGNSNDTYIVEEKHIQNIKKKKMKKKKGGVPSDSFKTQSPIKNTPKKISKKKLKKH